EDGERTANDVLFSERRACLYCGLSFEELSPQLFSFNSPTGACPECLGLGTTASPDPQLLVPDRTKSLEEGAIAYWGETDFTAEDNWSARHRNAVLAQYSIPADKPFAELTPEQQHILLYGGKRERISVTWKNEKRGASGVRTMKWEGVIPNLSRHLKETKSDW